MKFSTLRLTAATAALFGLSIAGLPAQQSQQTVTITVKAPDGTVVKDASAVARIGYPSQGVTVPIRLEAAGDGQLIGKAHAMGRQGSPMVLSVHASAPGWGFVSTSTDIAAGTMEMEATVTLVPGRQVALRLVPDGGRALPASLPLLIGPESDVSAMLSTAGEAKSIVPWTMGANGTVTLWVPANDCPPLRLIVDAPGFLRGFMSETIDANSLTDTPLTIALPETGTLKTSFRSAEGVTPLSYHGISVSRTFMRFMDRLERAGSEEPTGVSVELTDLAPGTYDIAFEEMNWQRPSVEMMRNQSRMFSERRKVTVAAGETVEAGLEYRPFDVEQLKGDHTLELTLTDSSGKPVAREWELTVTPERGKPPVTVGSGTTGADGRATVAGLSTKFPSLYLTSGKTRVGRVALDTTAKTTQLTQALPPGAGDMAPDVVLTDAVTGKPVRLSDFRGQVIFIDFWAVWCGPCQAPMQHNSDVMARRAADWAGKAAVVAISCDEELEVMKEHVAKKEWGNMRHLWAEEGGRGFDTTAMRTYGVTGIPTALLIDATGRIVWRGHPASYNFEAEIDKMLAAATP